MLSALFWWLVDTVSASYFATSQRRLDDGRGKEGDVITSAGSEKLRDYFVVAKTRGGTTWLRDTGGCCAEPSWTVPLSDQETEVWFHPTMEIAEKGAEGYNRSLSARRRAIILAVGFGTTLGLRLAGIGLV